MSRRKKVGLPRHGLAGVATGTPDRRHRWWRIAIVLLVALMAAWAAAGLFHPVPQDLMDEPEYLILAEGYRHGLLHRMPLTPRSPVNLPAGPLLPLLLAGFQSVAGTDPITAKLLIAAMYPVLAALIAVLLMKRFHPLWAGLAALAIALTFPLADYSWQVMTEIPFALLIAIWLLAWDRWERSEGKANRWRAVVLGLTACAYLLRAAGIGLGVALAAWALLRRRWRDAAITIAIVVALPLAWNALLSFEAARVGETFGSRHIQFIAAHGGGGSPAAMLLGTGAACWAQIKIMAGAHLLEFLSFVKGYRAALGETGTRWLSAAVGPFFLLSALAGCVVLVRQRRPAGVLGLLIPVYLAEIVLFQSAVRFLVPIFPFLVYAAMAAWGSAAPLLRRSRHTYLPLCAAGVALLGATQVVVHNGISVRREASRRAAWREGRALPPWREDMAQYLAVKWIGEAFPPMTETIGSFKPTLAYLVGHQYSLNLPRALLDLAALRAYLDETGATLVLEDTWTTDGAVVGPLLAEGEGSCFKRLTRVYVGADYAAVWRYLGSKDTVPQQPKIAPWG